MYYIYVYLDPRKSGNYVYIDFSFNNEPFYIGKGKNERDKRHLTYCKNKKRGSYPFYDKLNKIITDGYKPIIRRIKFFEDEKDALLYEKELISIIGRKSLNTGTLLNLTDGGIGGNTFNGHTEEQKQAIKLKLSVSLKGKNKGKTCSEQQKRDISNTLMGRKNPEHSIRMKSRKQTNEQIENAAKGRLKNKAEWDKKITQYSLDNIIIKEWNNFREISKTKCYNTSVILKNCRENKGTSSKFIWRWK